MITVRHTWDAIHKLAEDLLDFLIDSIPSVVGYGSESRRVVDG